jgi:hypothetical protein
LPPDPRKAKQRPRWHSKVSAVLSPPIPLSRFMRGTLPLSLMGGWYGSPFGGPN